METNVKLAIINQTELCGGCFVETVYKIYNSTFFYLGTPCNIGQNVLLEKKLETLMKTY